MPLDAGDKLAIATGVIGAITGIVALAWNIHRDRERLRMEQYKVYGGAANPWFQPPSENVDMPQGGTDLGPTGVPDYSPMLFWKRQGRM
jgi:hypothetical protein